MVASPAPLARTHLEDPLIHLPCSAVVEHRKGSVVYGRSQPSVGLYLVIEGKVKVSRCFDSGEEVVVDIYQSDEFFGESAFLRMGPTSEEARAFEKSKIMSWTVQEMEAIAARQPRLAVALLQVLAQRNVDLTHRIESFAVDNIGRRIARTLIRLAERMGTQESDGSVHMLPLTHELLSQYVGTSREVVTLYMNRFRRQGYLRYSRTSMTVARPSLQEWLGQPC